MKNKINWKKFFIISILGFIGFILIADIILDLITKPKEFSWEKIFSFENLFWKVLAGLVLGYFLSSEKVEKEN
jgi:hypothetical protein